MHGLGKLTYENGEYYDGEWVRGEWSADIILNWSAPMNDFPRIIFSRISLTLKGKRHGKGEYLYSDGSKYIGNWENDKIQGEGTSWYPNGNKYVHGVVIYYVSFAPGSNIKQTYFALCDRYVGEWVNGKINGKGM